MAEYDLISEQRFHSTRKTKNPKLAKWVATEINRVLIATNDCPQDIVFLIATSSLFGDSWVKDGSPEKSTEMHQRAIHVLRDYGVAHTLPDWNKEIIQGLILRAFERDTPKVLRKECLDHAKKISSPLYSEVLQTHIFGTLTNPHSNRNDFRYGMTFLPWLLEQPIQRTKFGDIALNIVLQNGHRLTEKQTVTLMDAYEAGQLYGREPKTHQAARQILTLGKKVKPKALTIAYGWVLFGGASCEEHFQLCSGFIKGQKNVLGVRFSPEAAPPVVESTQKCHGDKKYYPQMVALLPKTFTFASQYRCPKIAAAALKSATSKDTIDSFLIGNARFYGREGKAIPREISRLAGHFKSAALSPYLPSKAQKACAAAADYLTATAKLYALNAALLS